MNGVAQTPTGITLTLESWVNHNVCSAPASAASPSTPTALGPNVHSENGAALVSYVSNQRPGNASTVQINGHSVQLAAAPAWIKGAIGALAGAAVYVAVSAMVTAAITATERRSPPSTAIATV